MGPKVVPERVVLVGPQVALGKTVQMTGLDEVVLEEAQTSLGHHDNGCVTRKESILWTKPTSLETKAFLVTNKTIKHYPSLNMHLTYKQSSV